MIEAIIFDWIGTLHQFDGKGLFPYSEKVLMKLYSKYKMAVISEAISDNVETRLRQIGELERYLQVIIADINKTPEQFVECMNRLGVKPENTLVVDDITLRGIMIGNKLGCKTAWIQRGKYSDEIPNKGTGEPTYRINSVEDLLTIL